MKFAPISDRLAVLGAAKWAVHSESLKRAALGQPIIILSIGEPDLPPPAKVLDQATKSMRSGRTRYAAGQGEPEALLAIANHLSKRSGNPRYSRTSSVYGGHPKWFVYCPVHARSSRRRSACARSVLRNI